MLNFMKCVKNEQQCFIRVKKRGACVIRAASLLNGSKNIPQKACLLGVQTKVQIVRGNISIQEKQAMPYQYSLNTNKECFIRI